MSLWSKRKGKKDKRLRWLGTKIIMGDYVKEEKKINWSINEN